MRPGRAGVRRVDPTPCRHGLVLAGRAGGARGAASGRLADGPRRPPAGRTGDRGRGGGARAARGGGAGVTGWGELGRGAREARRDAEVTSAYSSDNSWTSWSRR